MLIKNPAKGVLTDWYIATLLQLHKPDKKTNKFVNIGLDGNCHVYQKLNKNLDMPIRVYSPTRNWADAGPALEKYGHLLAYSYEFHLDDAYKLPKAMRHITVSMADKIVNPAIVDLLFGPDWQTNEDLF